MNPPSVRVGTAYLLAAQGTFLVSAYVMHIVLGRYLGPVQYGLFGVTLYAATMIRTFVASGLPMAVSRYVSSHPEQSESIFQKGLFLQLGLASTVSLLFFSTAAPLARLLGDEALIPLFRIAAPIPIFFGLFFLTIQYYNGRRLYLRQSGWLTVSYILRAALTIGLAVAGMRLFGAVAGLVLATTIAAFVVLITRRPEKASAPFPASTLMHFSMPLIIASIAQAFLTDMDLMFVKRLVRDSASAGYYTSAKAMAQATPFAFYALSSALYPAVANAFSSGDALNLRRYIRQANTLLLIVILPLSLFVGMNSGGIISLFFGESYLPGSSVLAWLMASFSFLAVLIIHKTVITGCGFPRISSLITLGLLPLGIILQLILVPIYGISGSAAAATVTFLCGSMASSIVVLYKFKAGFPLKSTLKISVAVGVMLCFNLILSRIGVILVANFLLSFTLYVLALRIVRVWKGSQLWEFLGHFINTGETA